MRRYTVAAEDVETGVPPGREYGDHSAGCLTLCQKHPEDLMPEDGLQLFQLQRRGDTEHASAAVKAAVGYENVTRG